MSSTESPSSPEQPAESVVAARLVRRIVRQWPLIVACALIAAVAGYMASSSKTKQYEATTTLQLSEIDLSSLFLAQNLQQQGQDARRQGRDERQAHHAPAGTPARR